MFQPARRFRMLAAAGLLLAVMHGRAWGVETIWTKTANLVSRAGRLRISVRPKQKQVKPEPPPMFSWEKLNAEWDLTLARMYEAEGNTEAAYAKYKSLCRQYRDNKSYADASERLKVQLVQQAEKRSKEPQCYVVWDGSDQSVRVFVIEVQEIIDRVEGADTDQASKARRAAPTSVLPGTTPTPGTPADDDPLVLLNALDVLGVGLRYEAGVNANIVVNAPSFSLFSRPAASASPAPVLPERKDMLPDTDLTRMLIELGAITAPVELLALSPPEEPAFMFGPGYFH